MKTAVVMTILLCALGAKAQDNAADVAAEKAAVDAEALRRARIAFADSKIVKPATGELSPDALLIYEQPDSGRFLGWCYSGKRQQECQSFVVGAASLILGSSKNVCMEGRVLTIPKLLRIVTTWHQDNPHLWDFRTLHQQIELALSEEYPCRRALKPAKRQSAAHPKKHHRRGHHSAPVGCQALSTEAIST